MPDCSSVRLEFGGELPASKVPGLIKALREEGYDWYHTPEELIADLPLQPPAVYVIEDDDVRMGRMHDIEDFCTENQLTWVLRHGSGDEFDAGVLFYSPALGEVGGYHTDISERPVIPKAALTKALRGGTDAQKIAKLRAVLAMTDLPKVPPLVITSDP